MSDWMDNKNSRHTLSQPLKSSRLIAVSKAREASSDEVAQWPSTTKWVTRLACFTWMDVNHVINSHTSKWLTYGLWGVASNIFYFSWREQHTAKTKYGLTKTSVFYWSWCHHLFLPGKFGAKSPLEWPNQPKKKLNKRTLRKSVSDLVSFPINLPHWQVLLQAFMAVLTANPYYYPFKRKEGKITKQGSQNSHVSYTKIQKWKIFRLLYRV